MESRKDQFEGRIEALETMQERMLILIKANIDLINGVQKRERLRSIAIILLALSQLALAMRPLIQSLFPH